MHVQTSNTTCRHLNTVTQTLSWNFSTRFCFSQVESTAEGEAQRYFDHALTLKNTILFLRYNKELTQDQGPDIPNIGNYAVTPPLFSNEHFDEDTGSVTSHPSIPSLQDWLPVLQCWSDFSKNCIQWLSNGSSSRSVLKGKVTFVILRTITYELWSIVS